MKNLRRALQVGAFLTGLFAESIRQALKPQEPLPVSFKTTDIEDHPIAVERYRWTQGGSA